jgi:hypothetical protein
MSVVEIVFTVGAILGIAMELGIIVAITIDATKD